MSRFAVFGSPVAHSLSPLIHHAFAQRLALSITYERILTPAGELKVALQRFREQGGSGANITIPLKVEAYELCAHLSKAATSAMAVNTLYWEKNQLCGDNTDGEGLVRDLTLNLGMSLKGSRILILGAGGAVRGILAPLLAEDPQAIVIVNRTPQKAQTLAARDPKLVSYSFEGLQNANEYSFSLVINATSASLQDALLPLAPKWVKGTVAIDLAYRQQQPTVFQQWATQHGATQSFDGVGMLIEQAALSFQRWHRVMPNTQEIIHRIRQGESLS
jgi:shikimate dehydrogenase